MIAFSKGDHGADAGMNVCPTIRKGGDGGGNMPPIAFALRGRDDGAMPEIHETGDSVGALRAADGGSSRDYIAFDTTQITSPGNFSNPKPGDGGNQGGDYVAGTAVRRLTPRECERLQGFPDDYTAIPWRGKPADQCSDGPRYKALGNSMAVPVMRWIGERIVAVEAML